MNTTKGDRIMNRISRVLAVAGISGLLAMSAAGIAQASPGRGTQSSPDRGQKVERYDKNHHDKSNSRDPKSDSRL